MDTTVLAALATAIISAIVTFLNYLAYTVRSRRQAIVERGIEPIHAFIDGCIFTLEVADETQQSEPFEFKWDRYSAGSLRFRRFLQENDLAAAQEDVVGFVLRAMIRLLNLSWRERRAMNGLEYLRFDIVASLVILRKADELLRSIESVYLPARMPLLFPKLRTRWSGANKPSEEILEVFHQMKGLIISSNVVVTRPYVASLLLKSRWGDDYKLRLKSGRDGRGAPAGADEF